MSFFGKLNIGVIITLLVSALSFGMISSQMMSNLSDTGIIGLNSQVHTINSTLESIKTNVYPNEIVYTNPSLELGNDIKYMEDHMNNFQKFSNPVKSVKNKNRINRRARSKRNTHSMSTTSAVEEKCGFTNDFASICNDSVYRIFSIHVSPNTENVSHISQVKDKLIKSFNEFPRNVRYNDCSSWMQCNELRVIIAKLAQLLKFSGFIIKMTIL